MKQKRIYGSVIALLAVALALAAGAFTRTAVRAKQYEARLREVYDGAVLSALRQMEDMQLSLSKALLSRDDGAESQYLGRVSAGAAQVQRSLSLLPLSHTVSQRAVKFANQLEDYAGVLLRSGTLTDEDARHLADLIKACGEYTAALYGAREQLADQAAGKETFYPAADAETPAYDSAVSYPTLIYDGPFSDARTQGEAKGLGAKTVTREEALALARDFVGKDRVIGVSAGADMGGSIPCFGVSLQLADQTLQAAVTRQGGKILWLAPDHADFSAEKSVEECRESAARFLESRGFANMQPTYFQVYQGVAVISFAATQGNTILYPDLIKVQLRMDTAQVVGIEARNYWQNHTARGLLTPVLTEQEAQKYVADRLAVEAVRLCLIPTDRGEKLCYEFRGIYQGDTYLAYINALDGGQEELLKVVEGDTGLEAV